MAKIPGVLTDLNISDVHLGHRRTPTAGLAVSLIETIDSLGVSVLSNLDRIRIHGDLWDRLLEWPSIEVTEAFVFINYLVSLCKTYNIKLRVLEGTPSHDWHQSRYFNSLVNVIDVRYFDALSIDFEEDGTSTLYLPDEWRHDPETTWEEIVALLDSHGLSKVDSISMHGLFGFQIPEHLAQIKRHDEQRFLSICKGFIQVGHDHRYAVYDRIISQGSAGRLAHGEEEDKGIVLTEVRNDNLSHRFIVNKKAKKYVTLNLKTKDIDTAIAKLRTMTHTLPEGSAIAIKGFKTPEFMHSANKLFPQFSITYPDQKVKTTASTVAVVNRVARPVALNQAGIDSLLLQRSKEKRPDINPDLFSELIEDAKAA